MLLHHLSLLNPRHPHLHSSTTHPTHPTHAHRHHPRHLSPSDTPITPTSNATRATVTIATLMSHNLRFTTTRRPNNTPPRDSFLIAHNTSRRQFLAYTRIIQKYTAKHVTHRTDISLVSIFNVIIHPQTLTHMFIFVHITNLKIMVSLYNLTPTVLFLFFLLASLLYIVNCYISIPRDGHRALSLY